MSTPREHDTALAELYHELARAEQQVGYNERSLLYLANAKWYYRGRQRVTDMTVGEAIEKVSAAVASADEHISKHSTVEEDGWVSTDWSGFSSVLAPHEVKDAREQLSKRSDVLLNVERVEALIAEKEEGYTGWSRFFLVTSSPGHIHSSMHCSTCRWTTTYGWLPQLSGKTEAEAVEAHGPALCSVCYPSAPTEWVGGKITKAKAEKAAY